MNKIEIKNKIKSYIKQNLNGYYNKNEQEYNKFVLNILRYLKSLYKDVKVSTIQRILAKYTIIIDNTLIVNTKNPSYNKWDELIMTLKIRNWKIIPKRRTDLLPCGKSWIHDVQIDDDISDKDLQRRYKTFKKIQAVEYPAQRSPQWYAERDKGMTASAIGTALGDDHYSEPYHCILIKLRETFNNNENTYHGKKFEAIATLIYEYRLNVHVEEFGLCRHPVNTFLGASPDGIVSEYKFNQKNITNLVGRMLEIKCPTRRKINSTGEVRGTICPTHYWDQVQIQLECCDLDECDFWQCDIKEYPSKELFEDDTDTEEAFRSKSTKLEKGVLIQVLPIDKIKKHSDPSYWQTVYDDAKFIHPTEIEMTPTDCDKWVEEKTKEIEKLMPGYALDRVVYWYLNYSHCELIQRDRKWFESVLKPLEKMWNRIKFLRDDPKLKQLFLDFYDYYYPECNSYSRNPNINKMKPEKNKFILNMIDRLMDEYGTSDDYYNDMIDMIERYKDKKDKKR
jgi:putative phage-type endonuclease